MNRRGASRGVGLAVVAVGGLVWAAPPASASGAPVVVPQMFVHHEPATLVVDHDASALLLTAPGSATVATGTGEVLVAVDLAFDAGDRQSGVLLGAGPLGELRVLVERDGPDERLAVHLVDDQGGVAITDEIALPGSGLPPTADLRVEQHDGRLSVWLAGVRWLDRPLSAPEVVLMTQNDHGAIVGGADDSVTAARVLARA